MSGVDRIDHFQQLAASLESLDARTPVEAAVPQQSDSIEYHWRLHRRILSSRRIEACPGQSRMQRC